MNNDLLEFNSSSDPYPTPVWLDAVTEEEQRAWYYHIKASIPLHKNSAILLNLKQHCWIMKKEMEFANV